MITFPHHSAAVEHNGAISTHTTRAKLPIPIGSFYGIDADSDIIDVEVKFSVNWGTDPDPLARRPEPQVDVHKATQISGVVDYDDGRCPWTGDDLTIAGRVRDAIDADYGDVYEQLVAAAKRGLGR